MRVNPYQSPGHSERDSSRDKHSKDHSFNLPGFDKACLALFGVVLAAAAYHAQIADVQAWLKSPALPVVVFGSAGGFFSLSSACVSTNRSAISSKASRSFCRRDHGACCHRDVLRGYVY
jgi:hypothetical protein